MASWVLSIDAAHPPHWDYAQEAGFWDLRTKRSIEAGDLVYFWQSGKSFAGRVRATTDVYDIQPGMTPGPWDDWPGPYHSRFDFEVLDPEPVAEPKWGEVQAQVSVKQGPNWAPRYTSADDEAVVASYFSPNVSGSSLEDQMKGLLEDAGIDIPETDLEGMTDDQRTLAKKLVKLREGQQKFRADLIKAYGACAVTGTSVPRALDAAHISDYLGKQTQVVSNGILLRSDLHRLFDSKQVTVTAEDGYVFLVSPDLADSPYAALDGQAIQVPPIESQKPSRDLLRKHNAKCWWLPK